MALASSRYDRVSLVRCGGNSARYPQGLPPGRHGHHLHDHMLWRGNHSRRESVRSPSTEVHRGKLNPTRTILWSRYHRHPSLPDPLPRESLFSLQYLMCIPVKISFESLHFPRFCDDYTDRFWLLRQFWCYRLTPRCTLAQRLLGQRPISWPDGSRRIRSQG